MHLFVSCLSIKDIGRAVDKGLGSIRRGVTLEYDEANGFKFPIGDGTGCTTLQEHTIGDAPPQKLCLSSDCNTGNGPPVTGMDVSPLPPSPPPPSPPPAPPSPPPPPSSTLHALLPSYSFPSSFYPFPIFSSIFFLSISSSSFQRLTAGQIAILCSNPHPMLRSEKPLVEVYVPGTTLLKVLLTRI